MDALYFDDIEIGMAEVSGEVVADRDEMMEYAQRNDPWPIHVDEVAAAASPHGGVIASFGYVISLYFRAVHDMALNQRTQDAFLGALEWKVSFRRAVHPGDRLRTRGEVVSKRLASKGDRGVVTSRYDLLNQDDDPVISIDVVSLLLVRPASS